MKKHIPTLVILLLAAIWGSTWMGIKVGIEHFPPFLCAGLRFLVAFLFLWVILRIRNTRFPADARSWKIMLAIGLQQSVIYGLVFWGEQFIDSGISAVLFSTMPFFIVFFSLIMIRSDAVYLTHLAGILLSVIGTFVMYDPDFAAQPKYLWGFIAILSSAVISSYMAVYVKLRAGSIPAITNTAVQMLTAGIVLSLIGGIFENISDIRWTFSGVGAVLYLGVIGSAVAFALYMWVIKRVTPLTASVIPLLTPVVAILIGWLALNERLTLPILAGCGLILTGIGFINTNRFHLYTPGGIPSPEKVNVSNP